MVMVILIGIMSHIRCVLGKVVSEFYTQEMLIHKRWVKLKMFFMLLMIQGECIVLFQPEDN